MSWEKSLLDASFRGVVFDCIRTQDNAQRDTASHEYPYLDGADVEDLGRKARQIQISAIFYGDDYETRLQTFLAELDKPGHGELIHPVFGSIKAAQVLSYDISHDADGPDSCTLELRFVEATPGNPFFTQELPAQAAAGVSTLAGAAQIAAISAFVTHLDAIRAAATGILSPLMSLRGVLTGTLGAIRIQVAGAIGTLLDLIDYPRAAATDLVALVTGVIDLRSFSASTLRTDWKTVVAQLGGFILLPADVAGGVLSSTGSVINEVGRRDGAPGNPGGVEPADGSADTGASGASATHGGHTVATTPVRLPPAEPEHVALVTALVQTVVATAMAETASGIFEDEVSEPTLSPTEIEQITNDVRESLQTGIDAWRKLLPIEEARPVIEALRTTALGVQQAAAAVIEALPPLVTRRVEAPGNLHLVAFRWYGDYSRAGELARLNPQIVNPNRLMPGDTLYAYAR